MGTSGTDKSYSAWRWYAPCTILTEDGDMLPAETEERVLELTGFKSIDALLKELNAASRHKIPEKLQARIRRLFTVHVNPGASDEAIDVAGDDDEYSLPYPFRANKKAKAGPIEISAFHIGYADENTTLEITVRAGIDVPDFLMPRKKTDQDFCHLVATKSLGNDDLTTSDKKTILTWLVSNGIEASTAEELIESEDFITELSERIYDRLEQLVSVGVAGLLGDEQYAYLSGEEEKGFSVTKKKR